MKAFVRLVAVAAAAFLLALAGLSVFGTPLPVAKAIYSSFPAFQILLVAGSASTAALAARLLLRRESRLRSVAVVFGEEARKQALTNRCAAARAYYLLFALLSAVAALGWVRMNCYAGADCGAAGPGGCRPVAGTTRIAYWPTLGVPGLDAIPRSRVLREGAMQYFVGTTPVLPSWSAWLFTALALLQVLLVRASLLLSSARRGGPGPR